MLPFTIILGILLGSLVAIAFGLAVVGLIFWFIQDDSPRVAQETPMLLRSAAIFAGLAAAAAWGFWGTLRRRRWRYPVLAVLWAGLLATGWYYWP